MNKMTTTTLVQAALIISKIVAAEITAIQFEDGSGYKFNYQANNGNWAFIDLSRYDLRKYI
jgi:hypothetical protein